MKRMGSSSLLCKRHLLFLLLNVLLLSIAIVIGNDENEYRCFTNYTLIAKCIEEEDTEVDKSDLLLTSFTYQDGTIYKGYMNTNKMYVNEDMHVLTGRGTIFFTTGATYEGFFLQSQRHGWGKHTYVDGSVYSGCWYKDKKHGRGSYTYGSDHVHPGAQYVGEWVNGEKHGHGEYFSDEFQYCGDFVKGMFCGEGQLLRHDDGSFYEGHFRDNNFHGYGSMMYGNGNSFTGDWESGKRSGSGRFHDLTSSVTYVGEWKNDVMEGNGKLSFSDGFNLFGEWQAGAMVQKSEKDKRDAELSG